MSLNSDEERRQLVQMLNEHGGTWDFLIDSRSSGAVFTQREEGYPDTTFTIRHWWRPDLYASHAISEFERLTKRTEHRAWRRANPVTLPLPTKD